MGEHKPGNPNSAFTKLVKTGGKFVTVQMLPPALGQKNTLHQLGQLVGCCCKLLTLRVMVYRAGPVPSLPKEGL